MKNYFEELTEKGIDEVELSPLQFQELIKEGRITSDQLRRILIENFNSEILSDIMLEIEKEE